SIPVTAGIDLNNNLNALSSIPVTAGIDLNNNLNALSSIPVTAGIDLNNNLNALSSIPVTTGIDLSSGLNSFIPVNPNPCEPLNPNVGMNASSSPLMPSPELMTSSLIFNSNQNQFNIPSSIEPNTQILATDNINGYQKILA
ncbi:hypothetical protein PIROE2DRAFT_18594, partial [Piromyces sp. E2]